MEKKKTIFNIFSIIFAVLLIVGGISWCVSGLIGFVNSIPADDGGIIAYFTIEMIMGLIIGAACIFLASRILLDIQGEKNTDVRLLYCLIVLFSFDLALSSFLFMAIRNSWDVGYLWAEFIIGLAFLGLTIVCFLNKGNKKNILNIILAATMMSYFAYSFVADASDPINVAQYLWGVLALVFALATAYFALPLFKKEKAEEPAPAPAPEAEEKAE